jgi:tRNA pseudouridine13 synthase
VYRCASERIRLFGLKVVVGDVVALTNQSFAEDVEDEVQVEELAEEEKEVAGSAKPAENSSTMQPSSVNDGVHVVTQEDVEAARFSIRDVLLPLVGSDSVLPTHEISNYLLQLLAEDGLTLKSFATCSAIYRTEGGYRRLIQIPGNFEYCVIGYADPDVELVDTELSAFVKRRRNAEAEAFEPAAVPASSLPNKNILNEGGAASNSGETLRAAILRFTLPPGTYATIMLRELTKESTRAQYQAQLTNAGAADKSDSAPSESDTPLTKRVKPQEEDA